jgi:hypothetical protein
MEKFFLFSKTIQGILIMLVPLVLQLTGVELPVGEDAGVGSVITMLFELVGAAWATYGRIKATGAVTVKP